MSDDPTQPTERPDDEEFGDTEPDDAIDAEDDESPDP